MDYSSTRTIFKEIIIMTRRFTKTALCTVCVLLLAASFAPGAENILKLVPESASGLVIINQPGTVSAKLQALGREMQLPVPDLLAMFKANFNVSEGFDENGTIALVVLPPQGNEPIPIPTPILLLPVTDYGKFIQQFEPENATEEVTKIKVMNTPAWVRNIGGYAALTDISHREVLEKTLKISPEVPRGLAPWQEWLATNDVAGVLLRPGIKNLSAAAQKRLQMLKSILARGGEQQKQAAAVFEVYEKILQAAAKEITACALGLQLDKQNVLRATSRTALVSDGQLAKLLGKLRPAKENFLKGLPDEPFVAAGGGVFSDAIMEETLKFSFNMMKTMPEMYGLNKEQMDKWSATTAQKLKGIRSMSMVLGAIRGDESLYAHSIGIMEVEDSTAYMANYEQYIEQYNELIKSAHSPLLQSMEIEKSQLDGTAALQITMKAPKPPAGQQTPQYEQMMEVLFGPGGELTSWLAPAGDHHVVMGYVNQDSLKKTMQAVRQGKPGLANNAEVLKTAALLPSNVLAIVYLSPQGTNNFIKRMISVIAPPEVKELKLPEFPKTPPIGYAISAVPNELQTCLVVPAEVFRAVGQYIGKIKAMHNGNSTVKP
jgi:hypothetical protein